MRVVHSRGTARRGLLALVLALLALVLVPGVPAGSPSAAPVGWSNGWSRSWSGAAREGALRTSVTGAPVHLRIPRLDVAADVVAVDAEGGVLVPPADPALVGWWRDGARPGSPDGAVVLTGHTVHSGGGVFDDLAVLGPSDVVEVTTPRGSLTYVVTEARDLSKAQLASVASDLFGSSGPARMVLVTCTDWDGERYRGNTVVVARTR